MKKKVFFISIFLFFVVILFLSPICGDDWSNYLISKKGIYHSFGNALGMYFAWEGRIVSRVFINLLTGNKILWNIINSLFITGIIYFIIKLVNPKHKKTIYALTLLLILCMNIYTFSQVIVWIAGNITYLFVLPLLLGYFYFIISDKKDNKIIIFLFSILNFIMPMFIEHMAIILVFSNILFIASDYVKKKKLNKVLIIYLICSLCGTILMLISPGSINRSSIENIEFSKLSIFNKIIYNIPNFIYYTFIVNSFLLMLMTIGNYYLLKNNIKNKLFKGLSMLYMLVIPLMTTIGYNLSNLTNINFDFFINQNNKLLALYYFSYLIITLILIFISTRKDKKYTILFFYILGIASNIIMMASPIWGHRTSFASYIFLGISMLMIIDKYINNNKVINYFLYLLIILCSLFYFVLYGSVYLQYISNLKIIKNGIKNNEKVIEIYKYPNFSNCNINPSSDFHMIKFKKYYKINKDVEVKLIDNNWKYLIIYHK